MTNYYFLGIGGIGMSAIARYFRQRGFEVGGYDRVCSHLCTELQAEGIDIHYDDLGSDIDAKFKDPQRTVVVYTPAIPPEHKELCFFKENNFRVYKRSEILGEITKSERGLCVAGTHGKTTISSMIAHLLRQSSVDCNAFLGGISLNYNSNLLLSDRSDLVVIEADEYDRSFHRLSPFMAVVSSTDADHLDIYHTHEGYIEAFEHFCGLIKEGGTLIYKKGITLSPHLQRNVKTYTYSASENADFYADNIRIGNGKLLFDAVLLGEKIADLDLGVPVWVNVENAIAAIAVAWLNGATADELRAAIASYKGVRRRFEQHLSEPKIYIDDYAHHPKELASSIRSLKLLYADKKVLGVFQPHLYSRTADFCDEFAQALSLLDEVVLVEIYPAREEPIPGVSSQIIFDRITNPNKTLTTKAKLLDVLGDKRFDVLVTLGAGDIDMYVPRIKEFLTNQYKKKINLLKKYMKKRIFLSLAILLATGNISIFSQNAEKFLEELTTSQWKAKSPANVVSMRDGERFAYVSDNKKQIIVDYYKSSKPEVIFDVDKVEKSPVKQVEWFQFDDSEGRILLLTNSRPVYRRSSIGSYYVYDINRRRITPVSENGAQTSATFSPNGRIVAFARDNNLFLKKLDFDTESQITKDGKKNELINGVADWVYEEEFANVQYFQFSPDNKLLAFVKFYEKDVENFSMQLFTDTMPVLQTFKYPRAGTNNSRVSVWVYDVENRTTTRMKMEGTDFYIPIIKWTSSSDALAVVKLARDQKQIDIINYNPRSGLGATLYSESSKTYVDYRNYNAMFTSDNSFLIMSEKDGYRHIYLHSPTGIQKQQITSGNFDVVNFYGYDEASKTAYFQAAFHTPTEREVCRSVNGKISALDNRKGFQSAKFSANFKYAIYNFSNIMTPNIYSVINNSGKILRVIEDNRELVDRFKKSNLPGKRFFKFTNSEGTELNGWILEPVGVSKSGKMPLVLTQYSGPDSQEVLNRWGCDWEYYLALNGFAVACVDSRGTGGRGNAFRTATYGQLGVLEAKDQIDAANYLKRNEFPNSEIGIWGWSYGGFMTLKCMISDNSPFKAGVAIAPVTDWKLYNTAYTERFMNRPQENYDGYEKANLLKQADKLKGSLLMIHGTADDNVHTQNTYLMAEQLVDAGIQFDMQLYTNKNHSILGSKARYNLYKRCMEFFGAKLK